MTNPAQSLGELRELHDARNYFALRDRLQLPADRQEPDVRFFRAAVQTAFNEHAESNETIRALLTRRDLDAIAKVGGAGGMRDVPSFRLPTIDLEVTGQLVRLANVDVYRTPITASRENFLFCNIGLDVLQQFDVYRLNFQTMSIVLEK